MSADRREDRRQMREDHIFLLKLSVAILLAGGFLYAAVQVITDVTK